MAANSNNTAFYSFSRLWPILFLSWIFFMTFVARAVLSPLMPSLEGDLNISHTQAGSLFFVMAMGYCGAMLGSGFVSGRITHRYTIMASAVLVGIALLILSAGRNLWEIRAAVFFLGMAAGLYLPSGITTLTDMVQPKDWGKAVSIHELAPNLAFVAAPVLAEVLMLWFSWRVVLAVIGIATIGFGLVFARFGRGGRFPGQPPRPASVRRVMRDRSFWVMVVLFGLAISSTMGIYNMLPLYLTSDIGISRPVANTLMALSRVMGLGTALISGWATDRFGARKTIVYAFVMTGTATVCMGAFTAPEAVVAAVFFQAVLSTIYFPAGFTALSSLFSVDIRNVAIAFTIPLAFMFGSGVIPAVIGMFGDAGLFAWGFILAGGLMLAGCLLVPLLRNLESGIG
ncbi:MAG: MFS transporter [Thermodesulfobacteriota bacterium]|nr:MFS transporter [Thermodesulfobacteriota bacterium]